MRWKRHYLAALAALGLLALGPGLVSTDAVEAADSPSETAPNSITTQLQPGWNMIGWVGRPTPTGRLFEELPSLERISAWDAEQQSYQRAWRGRNQDLPTLKPGMGLLLRIGGDVPVVWTRPIESRDVVVRLREGLNLVGWTGDGDAPDRKSLVRLGDALNAAWVRDAASGRYFRYDRGAGSPASATPLLRRGDALWVRVSEPVNWWQRRIAGPPIEFLGDVPEWARTAILAEYESVRAFLAEHFAVVARDVPMYVGADRESVRGVHRTLFGEEPSQTFCGRYSSEEQVYVTVLRCAYPPSRLRLDERHVSAVLDPLIPAGDTRGPEWLTLGTDRYFRVRYQTGATPAKYERARTTQIENARLVGLALRDLFERDDDTVIYDFVMGGLGFLAVEWLAERAGDPAIFDYHRLVRPSRTWEEAFSTAFGITVEEFFDAFEPYRAQVAPPLPHLGGEASPRPAVVFVGDVPEETQAAMLADIAKARAFLRERFDSELGDFTLYVGSDTSSILRAAPKFNRSAICTRPGVDDAAIALDLCGKYPRHDIYAILGVIPTWDIPPTWLRYGVEEYVLTAYREAVKGVDVSSHLEWLHSLASRSTRSLRSLETPQEVFAAGTSTTRALGYFAVKWLVWSAGEPALLEFYAKDRNYLNWERVFRTTFHVHLREFYDLFDTDRTAFIR